MLLDVAIESFIVEAKVGAPGVEILFIEIIAVVTVEVADRPDGLHHDLKFTRGGFQNNDLRYTSAPGRCIAISRDPCLLGLY
jgi:hypothetical protein